MLFYQVPRLNGEGTPSSLQLMAFFLHTKAIILFIICHYQCKVKNNLLVRTIEIGCIKRRLDVLTGVFIMGTDKENSVPSNLDGISGWLH